jgi:Pycsar effector protein
MTEDRNAQLRNLIAGYGDSIVLSDAKAMIAVLFVAIMLVTVLQFRDSYPWYLSVPVLIIPFALIFLNLLASVFPRYPRSGRKRFPLWRNARPDAFDFLADPQADDEDLAERCALLSRILWWKNTTLQAAYILSMACLAASAMLLFIGRL